MTSIAIVGGGPAGTAAALRATELGAEVTLLEARALGGTCVVDGCVPTRVLARAARMAREVRDAHLWGIEVGEVGVRWERITERVAETVAAVTARRASAAELGRAGVDVRVGHPAQFVDPHTLAVGGEHVEADAVLLCVGGAARPLPIPGAELATLPTEVIAWDALPERVAVVGSGSTGSQLVTVFASLGAETTLIDVAPRILPHADADVAATLEAAFRSQGVAVATGVDGLTAIEADGPLRRVHYTAGGQPTSVEVDAVVLATGWPARTEGLGLDVAGVAHSPGRIPVDDHLRTNVPHVYAPGDANQRDMLVQSAAEEGEAAAVNAVLGPVRSTPHALLPWGGFTDPDVAGVGLTEEEATRHDDHCVTAVVPLAGLERAIIDERTDGFLKLITDRRRSLLLGAHAAGESAVEVIQAVTTAMAAGADPATLARVAFAYPTYSAAIGAAAQALLRVDGADRA